MGILRVNQVSGDETQLSTLGIGTTTPVTGSVFFDGSGDYLVIPRTSADDLASNNFTIELWIYLTTTNNAWIFFTRGATLSAGSDSAYAGVNLAVRSNTLCLDIASNTGTGWQVNQTSGGVSFSTSTWNHIALVRNGNNFNFYLNGVSQFSTTLSTAIYFASGVGYQIGNDPYGYSGSSPDGYISNLRVLKGTALYTANFTPPRTILEPIQDTVLLCCNNPDSAAAVSLAGIGTSKTITVNGNAVASTFNPGLVRNFTSGTQFSGVTKFDTQGYFVPPSGTTAQRGRGVGLFGGGYVPGTSQNTIQFINIQSQGNAQDFGDLSSNMGSADGKAPCAAASATRALFASGYSAPGPVNTIEYVTIATTSNSVDFGDLTTNRRDLGACSSSTRALFGGGTTTGSTSATNVIEYVTIASLGNAVSFGTLTQARRAAGSCASPTRGIWGGGYVSNSPATYSNRIDYVTIATTGNATTFGDLSTARNSVCSLSSSIRGIFAGGSTVSQFNTIEYISIASLGNAVSFGSLTAAKAYISTSSNSIRGVFAGGTSGPASTNTIEFVLIASTGNATDFGDLLAAAQYYNSGCSDSHGGIS